MEFDEYEKLRLRLPLVEGLHLRAYALQLVELEHALDLASFNLSTMKGIEAKAGLGNISPDYMPIGNRKLGVLIREVKSARKKLLPD